MSLPAFMREDVSKHRATRMGQENGPCGQILGCYEIQRPAMELRRFADVRRAFKLPE
jgi:hypothetical protein